MNKLKELWFSCLALLGFRKGGFVPKIYLVDEVNYDYCDTVAAYKNIQDARIHAKNAQPASYNGEFMVVQVTLYDSYDSYKKHHRQ